MNFTIDPFINILSLCFSRYFCLTLTIINNLILIATTEPRKSGLNSVVFIRAIATRNLVMI